MRLIEARDLGFLEGELQLWLERDLVNAEQAAGIRALYGVRRRSLARILLWAGVALVGLGLVGFAAANWEVFARVMAVLRRWLLDLLRFLTRWGVSTALAAAARTGAALSLFPSGKNGEPSRAAPFALGVAGVFGLALTYPDCWGDFFIEVPAFATPSFLAAVTAACLGLLMLWQFRRGFVTGAGFLVLLAARYFFDGIFDLLSRAWGFTVVGAACLGLGFLLSRRRKGN